MRIIPFEICLILKRHVKSMWIIEEQQGNDIHIKSFPTGFPYLNVIQGQPFSIIEENDVLHTDCYLSGIAFHPFELQMRKIHRALTVQFHPQAISGLFNLSADEVSDQRIPIYQLMPLLQERLVGLINSKLDSRQVLTQVSSLLLDHLSDHFSDPRIQFATETIIAKKGQLKISELARHVNLSSRRLQQLFRNQIGLTPKRYSKVVRMQYHTYELLCDKPLDRIVPDGYYDQSHFIHDLKNQTGMLPQEFSKYILSPKRKSAYHSSNLFS